MEFDLSTLKKKKKKKALVLDEEGDVSGEQRGGREEVDVEKDVVNEEGNGGGAGGEGEVGGGGGGEKEEVAAAAGAAGVDEEEEDDDAFDLSKKKKKKKSSKKTLVTASGGGDGEGESSGVAAGIDDPLGEVTDDLGELSFGAKKKSKKKKKKDGEAADGAEGGASNGGQAGQPWDGRDYKYDELLGRVFRILNEHNPELGGQATKTILKPPQVLREGTKKTVFANFADLCRMMNRSTDHVLTYLMAELGTSGNLDGQSRLIIKGRFVPKDFEGVLRRYVNEYVMCNMCKSFDTQLTREQRLYILKCNNCGASRSVQPIKSGYQALIGKRSKQRAAQ